MNRFEAPQTTFQRPVATASNYTRPTPYGQPVNYSSASTSGFRRPMAVTNSRYTPPATNQYQMSSSSSQFCTSTPVHQPPQASNRYQTPNRYPVSNLNSSPPQINDQTYVIAQDVSMNKLPDFDELFGPKDNDAFFPESSPLTSDYFSGSKHNTENSLLFSPPPEKRPKYLENFTCDSSMISESLMEDKSSKLTTELLFGDASIDAAKIFSQSEVIDDSPVALSGIVDLTSTSSSEKSFNQKIEPKKKKPIESDSSLSSEVNASINSTYFDKIFDKSVAPPSNVPGTACKFISASEPIMPEAPKATASKRNLTEVNERIIETVESEPLASCQPVAKKASKAASQLREPIATRSKEKDLAKFNEILGKLSRTKIKDTVNTYYNTKERQCLFENKLKKKIAEEAPVNIEGDQPEFTEVKNVKLNFNYLFN
jgi:hypothetical protein